MEGEGLRSWATQVRDTFVAMEREGMPVRYLRSTIVPADESLLCILEASSEELVRQAYTRAGILVRAALHRARRGALARCGGVHGNDEPLRAVRLYICSEPRLAAKGERP